jgi:uridine kinase
MKPLVIAVAGGSGSGKSTVAHRLLESIGETAVAFIDMDAYYKDLPHLSLDERRQVNYDHPEAFDLDLLVAHLERLVRGEGIEKPDYDFVAHRRLADRQKVAPRDVVILDGILLLVDPRVRSLCDMKIFVDADADIRLIRRIRRDMEERGRPFEEILDQYLSTVRPMHLEFVEPSKRYADVIIPQGGHNDIAIEMLVAKIQRRVGTRAK